MNIGDTPDLGRGGISEHSFLAFGALVLTLGPKFGFPKSGYIFQNCVCSTQAVCHPPDAEGPRQGLNNRKRTENEMGGAKVVYEFSSSKKVNQR